MAKIRTSSKKMKKASSPRVSKKTSKFQIPSWIESFKEFNKHTKAVNGEPTGYVVVLGASETHRALDLFKTHALSWQLEALNKNEREVTYFIGQQGPVWIFRPQSKGSAGHHGFIDEAQYSWARDQFGSLVSHFKVNQLKTIQMEFYGVSEAHQLGALVGFDMAAYNYRQFMDGKQLLDLPQVFLKTDSQAVSKDLIKEALGHARAVNLARHLVNLPPNELNPQSFADLAVKKIKWNSGFKVAVWDAKKLNQEGMGLHSSVGRGAEFGPSMVHIKYRPTKKSKLKPVAFVGKGITFDTGGLDLKPSSAMRLMKKDMGGAATVMGLALWASESQYPGPLDFYLALAENSVDGKSFRPSDVVTARNGLKVEIDNTDAEGRLVLADVLDVACTQKGSDEAEVVIDVATLTGAIKVGLGAEIAGLFSNDDALAQELSLAGQRAGDLNWRMPLYEKYWGEMSSPFADFKNSGGGFGGAITAALFLQRFVRGKKWAHLDIYSWADKAQGAVLSAGGNGQAVQCLIDFLNHRQKK